MAYKLAIQDAKLGLSFQVKYENLDKLEKPEVEARAPDGSICHERSIFQGQVLQSGSTQRSFVDDKGTVYAKSQLKFYYNGEEVQENEMTKTFQIAGYQPLKNYTDEYVISKYYELFPHNNDAKKDYDKELARVSNLRDMKKLWDYLHQNQIIARGEMNVSSKGFVSSDAYLRAIEISGKWGLEMGIFSQQKKFESLYDNKEIVTPIPVSTPKKKLKMI